METLPLLFISFAAAAILIAILLIASERNELIKYIVQLDYSDDLQDALELNEIPFKIAEYESNRYDDFVVFEVKAMYLDDMGVLLREITRE